MSAGLPVFGWAGIAAGYGAVQVPLIAAMLRGRAAPASYLAAPIAGIALTAVSTAAIALMRGCETFLGIAPAASVQVAAGALFSAAAGYAGGWMLALKAGESRDWRRGSRVEEMSQGSSAQLNSPSRRMGLAIASHRLTLDDEGKHFKLMGTTGTGKSTAIVALLDGALGRGDRAVIADPDGGYTRRYFDAGRGDVILNPFDPHSHRWDLFGEIDTAYDVEQLARALIPDHGGQDRSWRAYARTFFSAVTRQLHEAGETDCKELYRLLVVADSSELRTLVRGTPAQPFLDEHNARMFDSIRSVTAASLGSLEYVAQQDAQGIAVRNWVRREAPGVLFMPYQAGQIAALGSTISAWARLAIFETMNRTPSAGGGEPGRIWFVVDELDALGPIDGLKDALARIRKFGGRCVLGFQSVAQVATTYGHGDAQTIIENCGNSLILRCSASDGGGTARFASQLIGDRQVARTTRSMTRRYGEFFGSHTTGEHVAVEPAVMPSEIEQLPDLEGYLKIASRPEWRRVALDRHSHRAATSQHFPNRDPVVREVTQQRTTGAELE